MERIIAGPGHRSGGLGKAAGWVNPQLKEGRVIYGMIWRLGIVVAGLWLAGCSDIVRIVPLQTPTPVIIQPTPSLPPSPVMGGIPTHISAPAIGLDASVVEMGWRMVDQGGIPVSEWEMPENEAAWHLNSARPGEGSNIVISGHNESAGGQVFARLDELQQGDIISLRNSQDELFAYRVIEKNIIRTFVISTEADEYLQTVTEPTAEEQLTLITCWPRWSNTHRLIIRAIPASPGAEPRKPEGQATSLDR